MILTISYKSVFYGYLFSRARHKSLVFPLSLRDNIADLGSGDASRGGSSPFTRTIGKQ